MVRGVLDGWMVGCVYISMYIYLLLLSSLDDDVEGKGMMPVIG